MSMVHRPWFSGLYTLQWNTITTRLFWCCYVAQIRCLRVFGSSRVIKKTRWWSASVKAPWKNVVKLPTNIGADDYLCRKLFIWVKLSLVSSFVEKKRRPDGTEVTHLNICWLHIDLCRKSQEGEDRLELTARRVWQLLCYWRNQKDPLKMIWLPNRSGDMNPSTSDYETVVRVA